MIYGVPIRRVFDIQVIKRTHTHKWRWIALDKAVWVGFVYLVEALSTCLSRSIKKRDWNVSARILRISCPWISTIITTRHYTTA